MDGLHSNGNKVVVIGATNRVSLSLDDPGVFFIVS